MANYKKIIGLSGIYSLGNMAQAAINFFLLPLYAVYLSPEDFGVIALVTISATLLTIIIDSVSVASIKRYYYHKDYQHQRGQYIFTLFVYIFLKSLILGFLFYFFSENLSRLIFGNLDWVNLFQLYSLIIVLLPITNFFQTLLKINEKALYFIVVNTVSVLIVFAVVVVLLRDGYGLYSIVWGQIANLAFVSFVVLFYFLRIAKFRFAFRLLPRPLRYSYPLTLSNLSQVLFDGADRYILKIFVSVREIGLYDLAYRMSGLFNILISKPVSDSIMPSVYKDEENPEKIRSFLKIFTTYYFIAAMWATLFISLFAKELITVLMLNNEDFIEAWKIIPVVIYANALHGLGYFLGWGMVIKEKSWAISLIMIASLVFNLLLNFTLIPFFGIMGAAFATLVSYLIWNVLKIYYSGKYYSLYFQLTRLGTVSIVSVLLYFVGLFAAQTGILLFDIGIKLLLVILYILFFIYSNFLNLTEKQYFVEKYNQLRKRFSFH